MGACGARGVSGVGYRYCVAGYRTALKLRSVTVSVVVPAICAWKASVMVKFSESYAFRTPAASPRTVPQL